MYKEMTEHEYYTEYEHLVLNHTDVSAVLCFSATWCNSCQRVVPLLKTLSERYNDIYFFKFDVDEDPELADSLNVKSLPCLIFYKSGNIVNQLNSAPTVSALLECINSIL